MEDTEERSPEESAADLLQQRQWIGGFGNPRQNYGIFYHDFLSQIERTQNRECDDVVHVYNHQPTIWITHWNFQSQEMSQTIDISDTSHLDSYSS